MHAAGALTCLTWLSSDGYCVLFVCCLLRSHLSSLSLRVWLVGVFCLPRGAVWNFLLLFCETLLITFARENKFQFRLISTVSSLSLPPTIILSSTHLFSKEQFHKHNIHSQLIEKSATVPHITTTTTSNHGKKTKRRRPAGPQAWKGTGQRNGRRKGPHGVGHGQAQRDPGADQEIAPPEY